MKASAPFMIRLLNVAALAPVTVPAPLNVTVFVCPLKVPLLVRTPPVLKVIPMLAVLIVPPVFIFRLLILITEDFKVTVLLMVTTLLELGGCAPPNQMELEPLGVTDAFQLPSSQ